MTLCEISPYPRFIATLRSAAQIRSRDAADEANPLMVLDSVADFYLREPLPMRMRRTFIWALLVAIAALFAATATEAQGTQEIDTSWPREIESDLGKIIIYQPQLDALDGNILTGRSAVSLQGPDKKEPVFGALWFRSEVSVDRDAGLMTLEDTKVTRVKFPDATPEDMQKMRDRIEAPANTWDIVLTLEQVETSLAASEKEVASTENLKSDPPVIIFSQKPAVLISFDGDPETRPIKDSPYEQVVNTAVLIVKDKSSGNFYLSNGQTWYIATNPKGPWSVTTKTPSAIKDFVKPDPDAEPQTGPPPQIITATVPTELIVTSGAPNWTALTGNQLLYVSNTESTFIKEIATNKYYLLLSGRWFSSQSLDGLWTYERSDSLPTSFKQIPPASPVGDALTAVAGTNEAEDADADAEIPQTAAIKRNEAKTDVTYDGSPQFQDIPSTQVQYAVNTNASVLKIGDRYYVCDNGVWFAGLTPTGPWAVADSVPDAVQTIPPSSPVYNVRYVHVLRFNSGNCLRRLHARLHRHIPILRNCGLRNRLVLPSLDRTRLLLSASLHLGIQRSLQSVDRRMGIRAGLQHAIHQREHWMEKQLLPLSALLGRRRMVGAWRLSPHLPAAARISSGVPAAAKCGADTADRATGEAWLWSG
jgi:hypothetical protein